ncbi:YciI family protein [Antarctobacter jejuensis]|uniref:YciI family protein n=1 Tax=Antarctobacter jejuensis TaxID=1439938 RepID=UPI003FD0B915
MPDWTTYRETARSRGALALELFAVTTFPAEGGADLAEVLPDHLAYQRQLESQGSLVMAGPLSDETGTQMQGAGLIIYRAATMEDARALADADPMHARGARNYTLRRWMVNEGALTLSVGLSTAKVTLA